MALVIAEKDNRLYLQFWEDVYVPGGSVVLPPQVLAKEIDITAHIEQAVVNVLTREGLIRSETPFRVDNHIAK